MGIEVAKEQFLEHLEATGSVTRAAKLTGQAFKALYNQKVLDPEFDRAWEIALIRFYGTSDPDPKRVKRPARRGRPGTYDPLSHPESARKLKALGLSDQHVAVAFGISTSTFQRWESKYPEFAQAVKDGKSDLGEKTAIHSLYALMNGYNHPEEKIFYNAVLDKEVRVQTTKHYPPNVTAIIFWLCNRRPDEWQSVNKQRIEVNSDGLKELADVLRAGPIARAKGQASE